MPAALVQQRAGGAKLTASHTVTLPAASGAGRLLVAQVAIRSGATGNVGSITDNAGNTWQLADVGFFSGSSTRVAIWYAANAAPASVVTVNFDSALTAATNVSEWSGMATTGVLTTSNNTNAGTQTTHRSGVVTTVAAERLIIGASNTSHVQTRTLQDTANWTAFDAFETVGGSTTENANGVGAYRKTSAVVTTEATWTVATARNYGGVTAVFAVAAAASYAVTIAASAPKATANLTANRTAPTYTATVSASAPSATASLAATSSAPVPLTPAATYDFVPGADPQIVYALTGPNLQRGSTTGLDADDALYTNQGLYFGGANVAQPVASTTAFDGTEFTDLFFINSSALAWTIFFSTRYTYTLKYGANGAIQLRYRLADGTYREVNQSTVAANTWYVIGVRKSNTSGISMWINTVKTDFTAETFAVGVNSSLDRVRYGRGPNEEEAFTGAIAGHYHYNSALTDAQYTSEYNRMLSEVQAKHGITLGSGAPSTTPYVFPVTTPVSYDATTLRKSVGVNVHSTYDDTSYYDRPRILSKVQELGVTRIRDGIIKVNDGGHPAFLRSVRTAGLDVLLIAGRYDAGFNNYGIGESAAWLTAMQTSTGSGYGGGFSAIEGINEWNLEKGTRPSWAQEAINFVAEYKAALRTDSTLNGVRFLGTGLAGPADYATYIDMAQEIYNLHSYRGGLMPERSGTSEAIDTAKNYALASAGTKPFQATETGYHSAVNSTGHRGVSETVYAHYIVRELLWNLSQGINASYIYQLFDQKPDNPTLDNAEAWFGLYAIEGNAASDKSTWTLRRKLPGDAIVRLQAALSDVGTGTLPTSLPFSVTSAPTGTKVYAIARKDGRYQVGLVMANSLWNTATNAAITDTSGTVTLSFEAASTVNSSRPSVNDTVTAYGSGLTSLSVPVDGKLTLLTVGAPNTYTATVSAAAPAATTTLGVVTTRPTYTASVAATAPAATTAAGVTTTRPSYTAGLTASAPSAAASLAASQTLPTYTATVAASAPSATASFTSTFTAPQAGVNISAGAPSAAASLTVAATAPTHTASIAATAPKATANLTAVNAAPVYAASVTSSAPSAVASLSAVSSIPIYTAAISATAPVATAALGVANVLPVYAADVAASAPSATATVDATHELPVYVTDINAAAPSAVAEFTFQGQLEFVQAHEVAAYVGGALSRVYVAGVIRPFTGGKEGTVYVANVDKPAAREAGTVKPVLTGGREL